MSQEKREEHIIIQMMITNRFETILSPLRYFCLRFVDVSYYKCNFSSFPWFSRNSAREKERERGSNSIES